MTDAAMFHVEPPPPPEGSGSTWNVDDPWREPDEALLDAYERAVRASPHNLLSPRGVAELRTRHLPECVAVARLVPSDAHRLADVGTGAGLPGLVIAMCRPDLEVTLIESVRKKAAFVEATAAALGVAVRVLPLRAEDVHERFDVVTARAVAPLARLVPMILPLLRPGGRLLAIKGESWRDELAVTTLPRGAQVLSTPDEPPAPPGAPRVVTIGARDPGRVSA